MTCIPIRKVTRSHSSSDNAVAGRNSPFGASQSVGKMLFLPHRIGLIVESGSATQY